MGDLITEVEARFGDDGRITVRRFAWQRRAYLVLSHGRQWVAEDGRHLLVMTAGERVFEILYEEAAGQWVLVRGPAESGVA